MNRSGRSRLAVAVATALLAIAALASLAIAERQGAAMAPVTQAAGKCKKIDTPVRESSVPKLRKAVACLLNSERSRHARKSLTVNKALQSAAQKHAKKMVATNCLSHQCQGEADLESRIRRSGYLEGANSWRYAENTGCGISAEAMVANWMASKFHRLNILAKGFEDIGVGVVQREIKGRCGNGYGAFVLVFGFRDRN